MDATIIKGLAGCPKARAIRQAVFVEEQGFTLEFDTIDPIAWHLLLTEEGEPLATGRTFPKEGEPGTYLIGRVAVIKAARGRQLGREVLSHLEGQILTLGGKKAELSAQLQARGFYEKLGYRAVGEPYLDEHCPHITMVKSL